MNTFFSNARRSNPSTAFLVLGLVLTLAIVMFRPGGAVASLPDSAIVFPSYSATGGEYTKFSSAQTNTYNYDIKFRGEKQTRNTAVTGVSIVDMLKASNVDPQDIPFVKIRISPTNSQSSNDGHIALIPLALDKPDQPAMIISKWSGPNGAMPTPAIMPPQVDSNGISQSQIGAFDRRKEELSIIPAKPGAKIMGIQIKSKKTSKGEYRLSASVASNNGGNLSYEWFSSDDKGNYVSVGQKSVYTTTDATSGTRGHVVNVVVTSRTTGSTGAQSYAYQSKKADDGKKGDPFPDPTPATGNSGTGGNGTGTNGFGGNGNGGTITPAPGTYTPAPTTPTNPNLQPPVTSPTPPTTTPTEPVTQPETTTDTSGITNIAQNVSGKGPLTTVTGVLLSAPSVPASGGGGNGQPLSALPEPVATAATTIFQPVDDPGDLWPYLLSIMFALCFTGAVREWVNP